MTWKVTAPLVLAVNADGQVNHAYHGDVIEWLSDAQRDHFVAEGLVAALDAQAPASGPADGDGRPDEHATKAVIIGWLVANAEHADGSPYTDSELRPHTKDQLLELVEAVG